MRFKRSLFACIMAALLSACTLYSPANQAEPESVPASSSQISEAGTVSSAPKTLTPTLTVTAGKELQLEIDDTQQVTVTSQSELPTVQNAQATVSVTTGDQLAFEGTADQLSGFVPANNGQYIYVFTVDELAYSMTVDCQFPPQITFSSPKVTLGEALVLHASYADGLDVTSRTDLPFQPKFYSYDGGMMAFLPVAYTTPIGTYQLEIQAGEQNFHYTISVQDREFVVQNLTVDANVTANTAQSDAANAEWETKIEPLKDIIEPVKYWSGAFVQPVQGQITTEFGVIRYTNGSKIATRHSGIDIAAATGTQITAANAGKILFSDFLQLTGNTVVLDHGLGLKSFYYHMDSLDVQAGAVVKKGDPIGKVGTTGFSTGPHLHYSLLVNDVFINPWTAFEQGLD